MLTCSLLLPPTALLVSVPVRSQVACVLLAHFAPLFLRLRFLFASQESFSATHQPYQGLGRSRFTQFLEEGTRTSKTRPHLILPSYKIQPRGTVLGSPFLGAIRVPLPLFFIALALRLLGDKGQREAKQEGHAAQGMRDGTQQDHP